MTMPPQRPAATPVSTTSQAFFEQMYTQAADPWSFASSPYEQARYHAILRAVDAARPTALAGEPAYKHAFEPGCSIGVLTEQLAARCGTVSAADLSPSAVARAKERCSALPRVAILCARFQDAIPAEPLDLIVMSEIGYYCTEEELGSITRLLVARLIRGGILLACHWLGSSADHILSGDQVHASLADVDGLVHQQAERHAAMSQGTGGFRLDLWVRV